MHRSCDFCGVEYEAKRAASRFCSAVCRKRNQRAPRQAAVAAPVRLDLPPPGGSALTAATNAELEAAGRAESALGRAALLLAARLDASEREPGTALAALIREHRAALAEAVRGAKAAADPVDELRARRDRKRGA